MLLRMNISKQVLITFLVSILLLVACGTPSTNSTPPITSIPTQTSIPLTETPVPPTQTAVPTLTPTPLNTLEPEQVTETLQPLLQDPMNCAVPCFWGIIPGKTQLDEARVFFSRLGFTPFEGKDFYTITYNKSDSGDSSVTFYTFNNFIENITVNPRIPEQKAESPREWIAYSPETLLQRYDKPSSVEFAIDWGPNITIDMIMYFDTSNFDKPDLIVEYSGYNNMTPNRFCPLTASFDFVRLWMGYNPPNAPSFETVPLEKATSLTMDQFTQLMLRDAKKACFTLKANAFQ